MNNEYFFSILCGTYNILSGSLPEHNTWHKKEAANKRQFFYEWLHFTVGSKARAHRGDQGTEGVGLWSIHLSYDYWLVRNVSWNSSFPPGIPYCPLISCQPLNDWKLKLKRSKATWLKTMINFTWINQRAKFDRWSLLFSMLLYNTVAKGPLEKKKVLGTPKSLKWYCEALLC